LTIETWIHKADGSHQADEPLLVRGTRVIFKHRDFKSLEGIVDNKCLELNKKLEGTGAGKEGRKYIRVRQTGTRYHWSSKDYEVIEVGNN
jgi:hypothetical protein